MSNAHRDFTLLPDDAERLANLAGPFDEHLRQIESRLGVEIANRANVFRVSGEVEAARAAEAVLRSLYAETDVEDFDPHKIHLRLNEANLEQVEAAGSDADYEPHEIAIRVKRGVVRGRGANQTYDPTWDWHAQNIKMVEALTEKKYDVNYCWGIGTHSGKQGGAIMPEMLRWLWRDYPRPDDPKDDSNRKFFVPEGTPAPDAAPKP